MDTPEPLSSIKGYKHHIGSTPAKTRDAMVWMISLYMNFSESKVEALDFPCNDLLVLELIHACVTHAPIDIGSSVNVIYNETRQNRVINTIKREEVFKNLLMKVVWTLSFNSLFFVLP